MLYKRYQIRTRNGVEWTKWFPYPYTDTPKIQGKGYKGNHLLNEYIESDKNPN